MASSVIAMWIVDDGSSEFGHSFPFRNAGASLNPGRSLMVMGEAAGECTIRARRRSSRRRTAVGGGGMLV